MRQKSSPPETPSERLVRDVRHGAGKSKRQPYVAPRAGAWIETPLQTTASLSPSVEPYYKAPSPQNSGR